MKERPIIFSTPMVQAIIDGRKTQTRRVVTPYTAEVGEGKVDWGKFCWDGSQIFLDTCQHGHTEEYKAPLPFIDGRASENYPYEHQYLHVPYDWREDRTIFRIYPRWEVGDRLWVRETWATEKRLDHLSGSELGKAGDVALWYKAYEIPSVKLERGRWRSGRFMPRWASRLTLEITGVRVERLQEITEEDMKSEGAILPTDKSGIIKVVKGLLFTGLWDSLNAKRGFGWETNPWVWVIKFDNIGVRVK